MLIFILAGFSIKGFPDEASFQPGGINLLPNLCGPKLVIGNGIFKGIKVDKKVGKTIWYREIVLNRKQLFQSDLYKIPIKNDIQDRKS